MLKSLIPFSATSMQSNVIWCSCIFICDNFSAIMSSVVDPGHFVTDPDSDPDPDPTIFVSDFKTATKTHYFSKFFAFLQR